MKKQSRGTSTLFRNFPRTEKHRISPASRGFCFIWAYVFIICITISRDGECAIIDNMAIDFPNSPSVGDTFTSGGRTFRWNGTTWDNYIDSAGAMTHADNHASGGADPVTLAQSQVTGLTTALSAKVDSTDARLTDARTPTAHAASHSSGGSDAITIAQSQVMNLTTDLAAKAPLASPTFTGTATAAAVSVTGDLTVDTSTLKIDSTNKRVGVGTATPHADLTIASSSTGGLHLSPTSSDLGGYLNSTGAAELMVSAGASYNSYSSPNFVMNAKTTAASGMYLDGSIKFWANSGLTAGSTFNQTERMKIDSAGRVTMPYQPSATVGTTNHVTSTGTIIFDSVSSNVGGFYSTSNGRFTCPVTGHYFVSFSTLLWNMGSATYVQLRVNGTVYGGWSSFGVYGHFSGSYAGQGASAIISASQNDYIDLYCINNGTNLHAGYTWASFCLIK